MSVAVFCKSRLLNGKLFPNAFNHEAENQMVTYNFFPISIFIGASSVFRQLQPVRQYRVKPKGAKKKNRGAKKLPGDYVEHGMILYTQLGLKVYPGANVNATFFATVPKRYIFKTDLFLQVGVMKDNSLYALEAGTVALTLDPVSPYPYSPYATEILETGKPILKKYFHVLPERLPIKFRLKHQV